MSNSISLNPMLTTTAAGLFNVNSAGFTQGDAQDNPATKFELAGGVLSTAATLPIWAGIPIKELIPAATAGNNIGLGSTVIQAASYADLDGICVANQAYGGITTPQSNAPLSGGGMSVNYYRFGSNARIPLPIDPTLVSLDGGQISQQVSWDFTLNRIVAFSTTAFPVKILKITTTNNLLISYNSSTGFANWTNTGALALCLI
jgi:hypothetical protein